MRNRFPDYPSVLEQSVQRSQPAPRELSNLIAEQFVYRMRRVEAYVQEHPVTGIGAAFFLGICLGWFIKRR